ncbi:cytochrome P450 [Micromonospora sp. C28SCA-DRY-2]|uniref:cytochrome P450 n=1 Tax=Micromonospora sp. C28SCA-DRY-2 TaxID=3059522 RepID=UPI0026766B15|nr:cytochrome P450 [Micromonospora sp. C28SCA-DRY-2]MDO3702927.1 cytochrome P450 [Micromonospora sp. C28SCA-DRY-2]
MDIASALKVLNTPEGRAEPYAAYAAMHAHGPVIPFGRRVHIIVGYDHVDAMMRDSRLLLDGTVSLDRYVRNWREHPSMRMMANSLHSVNPPDHTRVRRVFGAAFTARRVAAMQEKIEQRVDRLIDTLLESRGGSVEFMETFAYPLPLGIFCDLMGVPDADGEWLRPHWDELVKVQNMQFGEALFSADHATDELSRYFDRVVAQRRAEPRDDFLTALLEANDTAVEGLDHDELIANLVLLLMAGWETVANMLGSGLVILLDHPEQARRLRADPSLAPGFVDEILRMESPIQWTLRWAAEDVTVAGVHVKANQHVQMMLGAANRDPNRFPDPDRFDPDRPNNHPLTFGAGAHICLGQALGRLQGRVAFPRLLRRLPDLALAEEPTRLDRPAQRGYSKLPVSIG